HRPPLVRVGSELKEKNFRKGWGDAWTSGINTPLPPDGWTGPDFDDSSWMRYRRLGDASSLPLKALMCMRSRFTVTDPDKVEDLVLSVAYRGGIVVYINGKEIARGHLPDYDRKGLETLAEDYPDETWETVDGKPLTEASGKDPQNAARLEKRIRRLNGIKVPAGLLRKGDNVLALEIHRAPVPAKAEKLTVFSYFTWVPIGLDGIELRVAGSGIVPCTGRPNGVHVWSQCPNQRIYAYWGDYGTPNDPALQVVKVHGARNGAFSGQIIVSSSTAIRSLKVEVSDLTGPGIIPAAAVQVRYPVADNKGGGMRNFDHSYDKSFDTLEEEPPAEVAVPKGPPPGATSFDGTGVLQPVWLTFNVPKDAKAGEYRGTATVHVEGASPIKMPIRLVVADWTLPDSKEFQTEMGVVQSPETVAMKYNVELWSGKHWELLDRTFRYMGMIGADHVYILLQSKLHFGNSQSMVRWIRKEGGGYAHDFSIVEKYIDLAVKHLGRPPVVCLVAWDMSSGWFGYETEKPGSPLHGVRFTVLDPKTGKTEEAEGPKFGTPESREFWKPVYDGIASILKARGLEGSMMHGIFGDRIASRECFEDLWAIAPGIKWVSQNHPGPRPKVFGRTQEEYLGAAALVYTGLWVDNPDNPKAKRKYGWQAKYRMSSYPRGHWHNTCPADWQTVLERNLVKGYLGIARTGFDFWEVLPSRTSRNEYAGLFICNRYPDNDWCQTSITVASCYLVSPGRNGPLSTIRLEMLRCGAQEAEARIFIEKALVDSNKRSRLGEDLAGRCQSLLDERQRHLCVAMDDSFWAFNGWRWEESTGELYRLASEVAKRIGN
ncbi:MAG: hypothetical protein N3A38_09925, partial [Planctomycetota bacterium]|nr:hypothetical protein [Planctomycetota bacterium]